MHHHPCGERGPSAEVNAHPPDEEENRKAKAAMDAKRAHKCGTILKLHAALTATGEAMPIPSLRANWTPWHWWRRLVDNDKPVSPAARRARALAVANLEVDVTCVECNATAGRCLASCPPATLQMAIDTPDAGALFDLFWRHGRLPWAVKGPDGTPVPARDVVDETQHVLAGWIVGGHDRVVAAARARGADLFTSVMSWHHDPFGATGVYDSIMRVAARYLSSAVKDATIIDERTFVTKSGVRITTALFARLVAEYGVEPAMAAVPGLAATAAEMLVLRVRLLPDV